MVAMQSPPADEGLGLLLDSVSAEFASRGVEVDVLVRADAAPGVHRVADGVTMYELAAGPVAPVASDRLLQLTDPFGEAVAELAGRTGARYDIIHAHGWHSGLAVLPVTIELGVPFVQSFYSLGRAGTQDGVEQTRSRSEMFIANQAGAIVAASPAEVTALVDDVRAPPDRIWVIPPGVDIGFFRPERARTADDRIREELGIAHDRPIIAVVGPTSSFDDQELAIRALSELHSMRGWAPVLVIVGDGQAGVVTDGLSTVARQLGVAGEVRFTVAPSREWIADLLAVATVAVVPSQSESLGLVTLESAASGTPVVGFRGARPGSVAQGTSGLLVDSRDPREWARTITELLDDQVTLDELSASARHHAEGHTWGATAAALLGVYASLG